MAIEHVECGTRAADRNARRSHALCRLRAGVSTRRHVRRVAQDEPREPASERAYPRYLRSNATRAPKHRLRVDRQYDRHGAPSIFGCEMLTLNVCVESCLRRVIITSSIERNVKRWRLQLGRLCYQPRTLCVPSRIALPRTVPRCACCIEPTHTCSAQKMAKLWLRAEFKPGERRSVAPIRTLSELFPGRPSLPRPPRL